MNSVKATTADTQAILWSVRSDLSFAWTATAVRADDATDDSGPLTRAVLKRRTGAQLIGAGPSTEIVLIDCVLGVPVAEALRACEAFATVLAHHALGLPTDDAIDASVSGHHPAGDR